jgi:hypothetical protein
MKIFGVLVLAVFLTGCGILTEPQAATKVLEDQGYTHIQITGYRWFTCGDDTFSTGFMAINSAGHEVTGVVCAGWMKGNTIRFDD